MYLSHFGLESEPFSLTPDTRFFLEAPSHREALNLLLFATRSGEGFSKVVGEVGTGKTLLCRTLLRRLDGKAVTAYVPNPPRSATGLVTAVCRELGLAPSRGSAFHDILAGLGHRLVDLDAAGEQVVLVLDEAQALPSEALEAVRLLTNLETERKKLLQVVLFGQPELDQRLATRELRQLRQRISFTHRLRPLTRAELADYVKHRLRVAGARDGKLFSEAALACLARASRGIPRLANVLCHKSLLVAYGRGEDRIEARHLRRAAADTEDVRRWAWLGEPAARARAWTTRSRRDMP